MKNIATLFGLTIFLCACSTQHNASISGLSDSDAQKMQNNNNVKISEVKPQPLKINTRFAAGQLDETQGHLGAATHQYEACLDLDPKYLPALYRMGVIYAEVKDFPSSIATWQRYITASNNAPFAYGNLGYCYELAGMPKQAAATYQKGIAMDYKNGPCRANYGLMLARQNKIQEAIRMWTPALTDAQIHYDLASIYQTNGRKSEAKAEYEQALACDPTLEDARTKIAQLDTSRN
jgi:tetratricopeptide (TPR) repeat protein